MCGIAGYVARTEAASADVVNGQLRLLAHRGPDAFGVHAGGRAAIGQTRLAVIDLETGDPPIATPDGSVGVALNGEIYNYRELRRSLAAKGHRFATTGDTEVLAHLAEDTDPVSLARSLHGMFAFAVWDARTGQLVLGRDRLGKKPLYYWHDGSRLVFGSEIKALLEHPTVPRELDVTALPGFLTYGYVPSPRTFFAGVRSLPAGHVLVVGPDLEPRALPYWRPPLPGVAGVTALDLPVDDAAARVRTELDVAVERRMVADVPVGAFLSGGVDSSAIVALMARHSSHPVRTFTIGFEDEDGYDERVYAARVARHVGADHTDLVVHPNAVDLIERIVWHHDQPVGDSSSIPTFLLSELARKHVTVALSGDGGDELFAGYDRFLAGLLSSRLERVPMPLRRAMRGAVGVANDRLESYRIGRLRRILDVVDEGLPASYRTLLTLTPDDVRDRLVRQQDGWADADWRAVWESTAGAHPLDRLLHLNLRTFLLDDLLPKADRMSMAHGLEVRSPFLDHEFVELALRLRPRTKVRGRQAKHVLKKAMEPLLPFDILHRPKRGFSVPLDRWFREDLTSYTDATLLSESSRVGALLERTAIVGVVREHQAGAANHGHLLWSLLTLEVFLRSQGW